MSEKDKNTPEVEEKKPEEGAQPANGAKPEEKKEPTVGDLNKGADDKKPEPETVGLDKFLEVKKENKELREAIKNIEKRLESGSTADDVADDIKALADEFNVDPKFLGKLTKLVESKADAKAEARVKPMEEKDKESRIDKIFNEHFGKAMESMPEYKDVVNPEVIKTLSLNPKNANKTFSQLIEETYGNAVTGKRTIEKTTPGGGKEPEGIDYDKAKKDPKYFDEIMANPDLKKKYNAGLTERISGHL